MHLLVTDSGFHHIYLSQWQLKWFGYPNFEFQHLGDFKNDHLTQLWLVIIKQSLGKWCKYFSFGGLWEREKRVIPTAFLNRKIVYTVLCGQTCDYVPMHFLLENFHIFCFKNKSPWFSEKFKIKQLPWSGENASNGFGVNMFLIILA